MSRTRIKICGITRAADARIAAVAGADAIGLVFYSKSPRAVDIGQAREIVRGLPPFVSVVALFVDADADYIHQVVNTVPVDLLQLYGELSEQECAAFNKPYIKAVQVKVDTDLKELRRQYRGAQALLLDTWHPKLAGGTGDVFDWGLIPKDIDFPIILAGGLNPDNVALALKRVKPWAVDVSGGVEAQKGVKNPDKIRDFVKAVIQQDALMGAE